VILQSVNEIPVETKITLKNDIPHFEGRKKRRDLGSDRL